VAEAAVVDLARAGCPPPPGAAFEALNPGSLAEGTLSILLDGRG